jgi:hypothetical protein
MPAARESTMELLETLAVAGLGVPVEPCEVLREITEADLPLLAQEKREHNWAKDSPERVLQVLRTSHHKLAQLLASDVSIADASMMTGRSPSSITMLQKDPAFIELVAYYRVQNEGRQFDAYDRLVTIGGTAMDILQERLEETPDRFSNNELLKVIEGTMDRSAAPAKGDPRSGAQTQGGLNVNIQFVSAQPTAPLIDATDAQTVDVKLIEEKDHA